MANIIPFDKARHREAQLNLPWYVAGELDGPEKARFEAHLAACPECQADLQLETRIRAEYPSAPLDVEHDWAKVQRRLGAQQPQRESPLSGISFGGVAERLLGAWRSVRPRWLGAAVAAQAVVIAALLVFALPRTDDQAYRALGAAAEPADANVVVMFHPDAADQDIRAALIAADARLVDGPLASGGYLLRVPAELQDAALSTLRESAAVASAEPLDAEEPR